MTSTGPADVTANEPSDRRQQIGWSFYDWANSGYAAVVIAVFLGPYLTYIAHDAACGPVPLNAENECDVVGASLPVLGLAVSPASFYSYLLAFSVVIQVIVLPITGALADSTHHKKRILGVLAYTGAFATMAMFFVTGEGWLLGAVLYVIAQAAFGASMVVYNSYLPQLAGPDQRDGLSARAWAMGYLASGILLLLNLILQATHERLGISAGMAVRLGLLSAGVWWALFTIIPLVALRDRPSATPAPSLGAALRGSVGQLLQTVRHIRRYPQTLKFLVAYLIYNDGIQSVIGLASIYAVAELGFPISTVLLSFLVVQFVAFAGALIMGRLARSYGAKSVLMGALVFWVVILVGAFFLQPGSAPQFFAMSAAIGLVLGGSQALSRSIYSQLIPEGKEAEYFSLYEISERGTSWIGALTFGLVLDATGSYRYAIFSLVAFFAIGFILLRRVQIRQGIADAGNGQPAVV